MTKPEAAMKACRLLVAAYEYGRQRGGSIDWDDVDQAYEAARAALGLRPSADEPEDTTVEDRRH